MAWACIWGGARCGCCEKEGEKEKMKRWSQARCWRRCISATALKNPRGGGRAFIVISPRIMYHASHTESIVKWIEEEKAYCTTDWPSWSLTSPSHSSWLVWRRWQSSFSSAHHLRQSLVLFILFFPRPMFRSHSFTRLSLSLLSLSSFSLSIASLLLSFSWAQRTRGLTFGSDIKWEHWMNFCDQPQARTIPRAITIIFFTFIMGFRANNHRVQERDWNFIPSHIIPIVSQLLPTSASSSFLVILINDILC